MLGIVRPFTIGLTLVEYPSAWVWEDLPMFLLRSSTTPLTKRRAKQQSCKPLAKGWRACRHTRRRWHGLLLLLIAMGNHDLEFHLRNIVLQVGTQDDVLHYCWIGSFSRLVLKNLFVAANSQNFHHVKIPPRPCRVFWILASSRWVNVNHGR